MIAIYRMPIASATQVGRLKIVKDRNGRFYLDGDPVVKATVMGDFTWLERADGRAAYVKSADLEAVPGAKGTPRPRKPPQ